MRNVGCAEAGRLWDGERGGGIGPPSPSALPRGSSGRPGDGPGPGHGPGGCPTERQGAAAGLNPSLDRLRHLPQKRLRRAGASLRETAGGGSVGAGSEG